MFSHLVPEQIIDQTPPWGLPEERHLADLEARYGVRFPPSCVEFCTRWADRIPVDNFFRWATADPEEDAYASLEAAIQSARSLGMTRRHVPFWEDNSNYYCFDTENDSVVFWEHDAPAEDLTPSHPSFLAWLEALNQG